MKIFRTDFRMLLLAGIVSLFFSSCKKDTAPAGPDAPGTGGDGDIELPGTVTGSGTPTGSAVSVVIGTGGGSLTTPDGTIKIEVPAGTFTNDQTVSIQPITNLNKAGTGTAYRLGPHGVTFNKPVTIRFSYTDSNFVNTVPEAISASYQDDQGIWQAVGNVIRDTASKTVTVRTTHFSDWSLFQLLYITPWTSFVEPGGSIGLTVVKTVKDPSPIDDLQMPQPDKPIRDTTGAIVADWSTSGGGFTLGVGSTATYFAPSSIPVRNPVTITASIAAPGNQKWTLYAFVYVGKEGINYRMDNGAWINAPVPLGAIHVNDTLNQMQGAPIINNQPAGAMSFSWVGGALGATQRWTERFPAFRYSPGDINSYWQFKGEGSGLTISPGSLHFYQYSRDYVSGTFLLTRAGKLIQSVPVPQWQSARFEGFFHVKWKK